jgi:hypothetical protein
MSPQIIPLKSRTDFLEKFQPQRPFAFELKTGSQSYIPPDPKDDKALHTALDLMAASRRTRPTCRTPRRRSKTKSRYRKDLIKFVAPARRKIARQR